MRCNVGINPSYLPDQMIIAEYRELVMVIGSLKHWNWEIKSPIPKTFNLGIGHMNFLKNKLRYLQRRHQEVKMEMRRRSFYCNTLEIILDNIPPQFCNDWNPTIDDSKKIRERIQFKLINKSPYFWRLNGNRLDELGMYHMMRQIQNSELFYV
jgi:deoxyribonuclease (pyrimidine dimer)